MPVYRGYRIEVEDRDGRYRVAIHPTERFGSGLKANTGTADISKFSFTVKPTGLPRSSGSGPATPVTLTAMSASEQSNGPARHREIEGWAAAVLSGLLIGSAAPDPHKGNFLLHRSCVSQVSLQLVTGLTKLMRWDVQSFRHGLAVRQSSAEVPRSAQLPGLAWVKEAG